MLGTGCWAQGWHCPTGMREGTRISFPYLPPRGWAWEGEDGTQAWGVQREMLWGSVKTSPPGWGLSTRVPSARTTLRASSPLGLKSTLGDLALVGCQRDQGASAGWEWWEGQGLCSVLWAGTGLPPFPGPTHPPTQLLPGVGTPRRSRPHTAPGPVCPHVSPRSRRAQLLQGWGGGCLGWKKG